MWEQKTSNKIRIFLRILPKHHAPFSKAGVLTQAAYKHYQQAVTDIMPALGTHAPVTDEQRVKVFVKIFFVVLFRFVWTPSGATWTLFLCNTHNKMFGEIPEGLFRVHDWRWTNSVLSSLFTIVYILFVLDLNEPTTRNDVVKIGEVPAKLVETASDGTLHEPWPAQVNKLVSISDSCAKISFYLCNSLALSISSFEQLGDSLVL